MLIRKMICEYVQISQGDIDALVEEYYSKSDIIFDGRDEKSFAGWWQPGRH